MWTIALLLGSLAASLVMLVIHTPPARPAVDVDQDVEHYGAEPWDVDSHDDLDDPWAWASRRAAEWDAA